MSETRDALLVEWSAKREQIFAAWSDLRAWMVRFNVHLKRSNDKAPATRYWANGRLGVAERLRIRVPRECVVLEMRSLAAGNVDMYEVTLSAGRDEHDFFTWYTERLLYRDPSSMQPHDLVAAQVPAVALTQHLDGDGDATFCLRLMCTDASLAARLRPGLVIRGGTLLIELVGVCSPLDASPGQHLVRLVEIGGNNETTPKKRPYTSEDGAEAEAEAIRPPQPVPEPPLVKRVAVEGKGCGFVAQTLVPSGKVVLADYSVRADSSFQLAAHLASTHKDKEWYQNLSYDPTVDLPFHLPLESTQAIRAFQSPEEKAALRRAYAVVRRNAWRLSDGRVALYPHVSTFNHSCRPNAVFCVLNGKVFACRDIQPGEEVTVSYTPQRMYAPTAMRRELLRQTWDFDCACTRCEDPRSDDRIVETDAEKEKENEASEKLAQWTRVLGGFAQNSLRPSAQTDDNEYMESPGVPGKVLSDVIHQVVSCEWLGRAHWLRHAARALHLLMFSVLEAQATDTATKRPAFLASLEEHARCLAEILDPWSGYKARFHEDMVEVASREPLCCSVQTTHAAMVKGDPTCLPLSNLWGIHGRRCVTCTSNGASTAAAPMLQWKMCTRCGITAYCSAACQRQDWSFHRTVCK